jgi:uracil-DNA glycosylase
LVHLSDTPKSLAGTQAREARLADLDLPHIAPLSAFVRELRLKVGAQYAVPYFDPLDGGVNAECLFLLEAPGPKAIRSGFVSRNNPDETAKNFFLLNQEAGIPRSRAVTWNIVPWYVGSGSKIRPVNAADIASAESALRDLMLLLPQIRCVVLVGGKAASARRRVGALAPSAEILTMPHPSPMFVNRSPANRSRIQEAIQLVAKTMAGKDGV